jgi:hypothetical protein
LIMTTVICHKVDSKHLVAVDTVVVKKDLLAVLIGETTLRHSNCKCSFNAGRKSCQMLSVCPKNNKEEYSHLSSSISLVFHQPLCDIKREFS